MSTVDEPCTIVSGGPTQVAMSVTRAAGSPPMSTVGAPGPTTGPPTWGIGGRPGVCCGQVCMSVERAAGGMGSVDLHEAALDRQDPGRFHLGCGGALRRERRLRLETELQPFARRVAGRLHREVAGGGDVDVALRLDLHVRRAVHCDAALAELH